ncbi:rod shape-determining protein MreD [Paenibacillus tuaregi]|uniref:rod shape-determining protein MreD n=1 Tax=Paenibacillus tuaregi TaxID=1816681 RepID=UPI000838795D|nr:rod shape-determining protein MreD [Paenibacillus tuaregi]
MKRRYILTLLLFLLFIVEGTIVPLLIPGAWQTRIIPHLVYVVILFAAVYDHRYIGLMLGLAFGMLHDVVFYGVMVGVYSFSMGLSGYLMGLIFRSRHASIVVMMIVVLIGSILMDSMVFGIYSIFKIYTLPYTYALVDHIVPTMIVQLVFALAIYVPLRRQIEKLVKRRPKEETA